MGVPTSACNGESPLASGCTNLNSYSTTCNTWSSSYFNPETGVGVCDFSLSSSFVHNNGQARLALLTQYTDVTGSDFTTEVASRLHLHGKPLWYDSMSSTLTSDGMYAAMPVSPKYTGDTFSLAVYARATQVRHLARSPTPSVAFSRLLSHLLARRLRARDPVRPRDVGHQAGHQYGPTDLHRGQRLEPLQPRSLVRVQRRAGGGRGGGGHQVDDTHIAGHRLAGPRLHRKLAGRRLVGRTLHRGHLCEG